MYVSGRNFRKYPTFSGLNFRDPIDDLFITFFDRLEDSFADRLREKARNVIFDSLPCFDDFPLGFLDIS